MKTQLVLLALFWAVTAKADPLSDCLSSPDGSRNEAGCYGEEFTRLDEALNAKNKKIQRSTKSDLPQEGFTPEQIKRLTKKFAEAQRHWEKYRDVFCREYMYEGINGTSAALEAVRCQIQLTNHRMKELDGQD